MLIDSIMNRRSIETPAIPLTANNIGEVMGTRPASSGVEVTHETALGYPALWRAVNIRSSTIGRLPLYVLKRDGKAKTRDKIHPAYRLLTERPNKDMGAKAFRQTLEAHAILTGGGFAYIERDSFGQPVSLLPLNPEHVLPFRENGLLSYSLLDGTSMTVEKPENILHIRGLSWDGVNGYGAIDILKDSIGIGLAAQKFQSVFFRNGASPMTVIELPGSLKDRESVERFRKMWGARHQGVENAHVPALLENGASLKPFSINPQDAEMLATREWEVKQIANIVGIPSYLLQDSTRTSFASLEVENRTFLRDLADPMSTWEEEVKDKLLMPLEREEGTHTIEFNKESIERPDLTTFVNAVNAQVNNGLLTVNEARNKMNLPEIGEVGNRFRVPANVVLLDEETSDEEPAAPFATPPAEPDPEVDEAARNVIKDQLANAAKRISADAKSKAKTPQNFLKWLDNLQTRHRRIVGQQLQSPAYLLAALRQQQSGATFEEIHNNTLDRFFDTIAREYLAASECQPDQLPMQVLDAEARIGVAVATIAKEV